MLAEALGFGGIWNAIIIKLNSILKIKLTKIVQGNSITKKIRFWYRFDGTILFEIFDGQIYGRKRYIFDVLSLGQCIAQG
jgi:hypothetical protein